MANEKRLIDANALIRRLGKRRENFASAWKTFDAMPNDAKIQYHENLECSLIVEDIPIVDAVEVVHGRWEDGCAYFNGRKVYDSIDCSRCEGVLKIESETGEYWKEKYKWCPFCGAKMDGDGNVGNE